MLPAARTQRYTNLYDRPTGWKLVCNMSTGHSLVDNSAGAADVDEIMDDLGLWYKHCDSTHGPRRPQATSRFNSQAQGPVQSDHHGLIA